MSVPDPNVWSGRASQEVSSIWRLCGLASMYPASNWSVFVLRAIMDISERAFSSPDRPRMGQTGHQGSHAPGRPVLHLVSSSRRPRQENGTMSWLSPDQCSSFVRAMRPFLRPGLRVFQGHRAQGSSRLAVALSSPSRRRFQASLDGREHGAMLTLVGAAIAFVVAHSKLRPLLRTAHAMRASLLASAIASTL
jgi:hypothetical protein